MGAGLVCLALAGAGALAGAEVPAGSGVPVAGPAFTLIWVHTVERTEWRERYCLAGGRLELVEARVRGSGAGMEPGEGARLVDGWWVWRPALPPLDRLVLAGSEFGGGSYRLCDEAGCRPLDGLVDGAPGTRVVFPCVAEE